MVKIYKRQWKDITICDNFMFQHIMLNKDICKRFLELLLKKEIADIEYPENEKQVNIKPETKWGEQKNLHLQELLPGRQKFSNGRWLY